MKKNNFKIIMIFLVLTIFLVSGQEGCPQQTGGSGGSQTKATTSAAKSGLDFSFEKGIEYLSQGSKIKSQEQFYINVLVENSGKIQKTGTICIRDDIEDIYEGIKKSCKSFNLRSGVYDGEKLIEVAKTNLLFGVYEYEKFPLTQTVTVFTTLKYAERITAETIIPVPEPQTETLKVLQPPSPITIKIDKRIALQGGSYKTELTTEIIKKDSKIKITSPSFGDEGVIFDPRLSSGIKCQYSNPAIKFVKFSKGKSKSIIKCETFLPKGDSINYPLIISLHYGVENQKKFTFNLQKEESKPLA